MKIENCEASMALKKLNITEEDISDTINNIPDNDFHCPITGKYVALVEDRGRIICVTSSCKYLEVRSVF